MVIVPVVALATVLVTGLTSRESNGHLPLPHSVPVSSAMHKATAGNGRPTSTGAGGQTYTTLPSPPLTACTVSVSNPSPLQGQTAETATVHTAAGAGVQLEARYAQTRAKHGGLADDTGTFTFPLPIDHAPVGVAVTVSVTATLRGVQRTCQTEFTPVP
jgi:hypothetical protein